jgi:hypothetical protein
MPWSGTRRGCSPSCPTRRAFDSGGARRHRLGRDTEPRIPLAKDGLPVTIQDPRPDLQQQMGTARRPAHLLLLAEALADHLIDHCTTCKAL